MEIIIGREPENLQVSEEMGTLEELEKIVKRAVEITGPLYDVENSEVSITLTNDEYIHQMNKEYRGLDRPTDVLSFPLLDYDIPGDFSFLDGNDDSEMIISEYFNPDSGELMLGDIIISLDKVMEQAENFKKYADVSSDAPEPAKAKIYQYAPSTSAVLKVAEEPAPYGTKKN